MEYASRGDLLDYINARTRRGIGIGEELAKNFFRQLAEGVAHCHRRNIVHRSDASNTVKTRRQEHPFSGFRLIGFLYIGYFR